MLSHPFTMIIAGGSGSGKTTLLGNMLNKAPCLVFGNNTAGFDLIIIVFKSQQSLYNNIVRAVHPTPVVFIDENNIANSSDDIEHKLTGLIHGTKSPVLIWDDALGYGTNESLKTFMTSLFTRLSHHLNLSCIVIIQNLFDQSSKNSAFLRTLNRNVKYIIIFKWPRDNTILRSVIYQIMTDKIRGREMINSIRHELIPPHSYVMFDFSQDTPDCLRIKFNIVGEREPFFPYTLIFGDDVKSLESI